MIGSCPVSSSASPARVSCLARSDRHQQSGAFHSCHLERLSAVSPFTMNISASACLQYSPMTPRITLRKVLLPVPPGSPWDEHTLPACVRRQRVSCAAAEVLLHVALASHDVEDELLPLGHFALGSNSMVLCFVSRCLGSWCMNSAVFKSMVPFFTLSRCGFRSKSPWSLAKVPSADACSNAARILELDSDFFAQPMMASASPCRCPRCPCPPVPSPVRCGARLIA